MSGLTRSDMLPTPLFVHDIPAGHSVRLLGSALRSKCQDRVNCVVFVS